MFNLKKKETMKKTYNNPKLEVVTMKMQQYLLDGSGSVGINTSADPINPSSADGHNLGFDFED